MHPISKTILLETTSSVSSFFVSRQTHRTKQIPRRRPNKLTEPPPCLRPAPLLNLKASN